MSADGDEDECSLVASLSAPSWFVTDSMLPDQGNCAPALERILSRFVRLLRFGSFGLLCSACTTYIHRRAVSRWVLLGRAQC